MCVCVPSGECAMAENWFLSQPQDTDPFPLRMSHFHIASNLLLISGFRLSRFAVAGFSMSMRIIYILVKTKEVILLRILNMASSSSLCRFRLRILCSLRVYHYEQHVTATATMPVVIVNIFDKIRAFIYICKHTHTHIIM